MKAKRTKYTLRKDGRIVMTKTIDGKRVAFYGQTDREVEEKFRNYKSAESQKCKPKVRTFDKVAEAWWDHKYPELSPNSVTQFRHRATLRSLWAIKKASSSPFLTML